MFFFFIQLIFSFFFFFFSSRRRHTRCSRDWSSDVCSSDLPVLFLPALGVGLGKLVNRGGGLGVPYIDFVAPGMLAATCMQIGSFESSYPVMAGIRWTRSFHAM